MDFMDPFTWYNLGMSDPATYGPLMDQVGLTSDVVQKAMQNGAFDPNTSMMLAQMGGAGFASGMGTEAMVGGPAEDTLQNPSPAPRAGPGPGIGALANPSPYVPNVNNPEDAGMPGVQPGMLVGDGIVPPLRPGVAMGGTTPAGSAEDPNMAPQAPPMPGQQAIDPRLAAQRQAAMNPAVTKPGAPQPPPMHGGVTGGVKTPEAKPIKPGSAALQMLLAALQQKQVPTLGHLAG